MPTASGVFDASVVNGDFNGDGLSDLALAGASGWQSIPVAMSRGDGSFGQTNYSNVSFAWWASVTGAQILTGDFDGDGRTDLALTGAPGWTTVPVAFSKGDGSFRVTSLPVSGFPGLASAPGARVVTGDFNHDGRTDLALVAGPNTGWNTLPVAFSKGDGTFNVTNLPVWGFAGWAQGAGVRVTAGDFNNDGRTDLALTGGAGWTGLPVAFSNGDGTFYVTSELASGFPGWASTAGVRVTAGDFNKDGRTDLALTGGAGWTTTPVAFSNGDGTFKVTNLPGWGFPGWAAAAGVRVNAGDFNNDGRTDLALTGGAGWTALPVAFSNGDGTFYVTSELASGFPSWASTAGVTVVSGEINKDGRTDLMLTGGAGWTTIPLASSSGDGTFAVTTPPAETFAKLAARPSGTVIAPGTWYGSPAGLLVSQYMVTVNWFDRSDNERGFQVEKRDKQGAWQVVHRVPTRNMLGGGLGKEDYTWVDSKTDISGQCYRIGAYNDTNVGYTPEICTVRPDPRNFPPYVATVAAQWNGLSSTNGGTGRLHNADAGSDVVFGERTFGVNLDWADTSLWRVEAQGGPKLMKGQAVALRVWGGGWLQHGSQTFGVNLELSSVPSYEWYVIGDNTDPEEKSFAGEPLASGGNFALWNKFANAYLVHGFETWGINLKWYQVGESQPAPPPPTNPPPTAFQTYRLVNCTWPVAHTVDIWVKDLTLGSRYVRVGSQPSNWNDGSCGPTSGTGSPFSYNVPTSGHYYEMVAVDSDPQYCWPVHEPDPNNSFNCVRWDSLPFLGSTTSGVVATATID